MSPRKTRRGKPKGDNVNESVSIIDDSMRQLESPSTHSRSLRTRRLKDPPKDPKETPKKDTSPNLNVSTRPGRRTRVRKTIGDVSIASKTIDSPNISKTTSKTPRKPPKKAKTSIIDETILSDEAPDPPKKRGRKKRPPSTPKSPIPDAKQISSDEDAEVASATSKIFPKKPPKTSNRSLRSRNNSPSIITPESSPITVPLTPHRSTKTPRKSPVNLGSPKTHSLSPKRLSKTPRKLSVISASPPEASPSPKNPENPVKIPSKPSSPPSSGKKRLNSAKFLVKTPKIVLKKSKTPKNPRKSPKNPQESPKTPKKSPKIQTDEAAKSEIANNLTSPQLILKRIASPSSAPCPPSPAVDANVNEKPTPSRPMITSRLHSVIKSEMTSSTPRERAREIRRSLNLSTGESPLPVSKFYGTAKSPKSVSDESKGFIDNVSNPLISEDDDSFEITGVERVDLEKDEKAEKTRSFHKNSTYELAEPKTPNLRNFGGNKKGSGDDTYELEEPKTPGLRKRTGKRSLSEMNCHTVDNEEIAPKRMCRVRFATPEMKRTSAQNDAQLIIRSRSATPSSKLSKKVSEDMRNVTKRRRSNSLSEEAAKSTNSLIRKRSISIGISDTSLTQKEARWNTKVQNESINRLSKPKLSTTLTDTDKKKKPEIRGNSAKKVPNFAQIHQKKFEKMESLVDAKKRIADRHNTLTSNFSLKLGNDGNGNGNEGKLIVNANDPKIIEKPGKIQTPDTVKNGGFNRFGFKVQDQGGKINETAGKKINEGYNRFGFKVRKQEATKIISQPLSVKIQAKKEEKRMALKGVRSNRRFELLMKSRNMQ